MNGLLFPALIEGVSTRRDGSVKVVVATQEMVPLKAAELFGMANKLVCVYISPKEKITQAERDLVDKIDPDFPGKSQSQRIRNVLYVMFEKNPEGFADEKAHYQFYTEQIIQQLKSKIDP